MKSKLLVFVTLLFTLVLTGAAITSAQEAAPAAGRESTARGRHCVAQAVQIPDGSDPAAEAATTETPAAQAPAALCFRTFAEALGVATSVSSGIDPNLTPADVTDELLTSLAAMSVAANPAGPAAATSTVIGIDFSGSNYSGSTFTWWVGNSVGCYTGIGYYSTPAPGGWNDRISSYRAYGGCTAAYHFEHANFGGAVLRCNWCSGFGAMDNRTSSWRWYRSSGHY